MEDFEYTIEKVKKEYGEKEFLKRALTQLAESKETPTDIFSATFGKIEETELRYYYMEGQVNLAYSCSVGLDRTVAYYEGNTRKTKTVTDWSPHSGVWSGEMNGLLYESGKLNSVLAERIKWPYEEKDELENNALELIAVTDTDVLEGEEEKKYEGIDSKLYQDTKERLLKNSAKVISVPGDRCKDFKYKGTVKMEKFIKIIAPFYSLKYTYNGKEYAIGGHPFGNGAKDQHKDYTKTIPTATKKMNRGALFPSILFYLAIPVLAILAIYYRNEPTCFVMLGIAFVCFVLGKIIHELRKDAILKKSLNAKNEQLQQLFARLGIK